MEGLGPNEPSPFLLKIGSSQKCGVFMISNPPKLSMILNIIIHRLIK